MTPLLIAGHGTADADGAADFLRLTARVAARLDAPVGGGFIELSPPPLSDAVHALVANGRVAAIHRTRPVELDHLLREEGRGSD